MEQNQAITTSLPICGTNTTVIVVQHSIVLGHCRSTNVLMNFHLSRWLLSKDFIAIDEQPWVGKQELKCWIRCCIIVTIVKVIVTYIRIYSQEMEIITLLVRDLCVTLENVIAMGFKLSEVDSKAWDSSFTWLATVIVAILFLTYFVLIHKAFLARSSSC